MIKETSSIGEQAWSTYQDMGRVLEEYGKINSCPYKYSSVSMAFQRLGETLTSQHNLDPQTHPVPRKWKLELQELNPETSALLTTKEMLHAKIFQKEEAIEREQAGWDTWTKGRTAGYRAQDSIQEALTKEIKRDYFQIKAIVDTTFEDANKLFNQINELVQTELARLRSKEHRSDEKIEVISTVLKYLQEAILFKYKASKEILDLSMEQMSYIDSINLYSLDTMLDAEITEWSLRQALNISGDSLLSLMFSPQEALWGKTTSLRNVEKALYGEKAD